MKRYKVFRIDFTVPWAETGTIEDTVFPWFDRWIETFLELWESCKVHIHGDRNRLTITVNEPFFELIDAQLRWVEDQEFASNVKSGVAWV